MARFVGKRGLSLLFIGFLFGLLLVIVTISFEIALENRYTTLPIPSPFERITTYLTLGIEIVATIVFGALTWRVYQLENARTRASEEQKNRDRYEKERDRYEKERSRRKSLADDISHHISNVDKDISEIYKLLHSQHPSASSSFYLTKANVSRILRNYTFLVQSVKEVNDEALQMTKEMGKWFEESESLDYDRQFGEGILDSAHKVKTVIEEFDTLLDFLDILPSFFKFTKEGNNNKIKLDDKLDILSRLCPSNDKTNNGEERRKVIREGVGNHFSDLVGEDNIDSAIESLCEKHKSTKNLFEKYTLPFSLSEEDNNNAVNRLFQKIGRRHERNRNSIDNRFLEQFYATISLYHEFKTEKKPKEN